MLDKIESRGNRIAALARFVQMLTPEEASRFIAALDGVVSPICIDLLKEVVAESEAA